MARSLYFAYGSNLHVRQMRRRCPGAEALGKARLPDYRLAFTRYSAKRKGGVADILPEAGSEVWGALYEVGESELASLDQYENVPHAYRRETVRVLDHAGRERDAWVYFANQTGHFAPSKQYLGIIISGAGDHDLPEAYIEALRAVRTYS